ncbi:TetR/AcrR family transcriptional regulator [Streptomyces sp. NPDC051018]|uniref:TetR/AcrR family transcriptional regulator n=1 Tax=Streptomyces sp. NPDC051018 TaxID=3365639 RepID=UPI0037AAADD6
MTESGPGAPTGTPTRSGKTPERARRPKDRRVTIERIAAELFAERGYSATGVGDIADRVGVTPGAIYRHFSGKDDLLRHILEGALADFTAVAQPGPEVGDDPEARLEAAVRSNVELTLSEPSRTATYLQEWHSLSEAAREELRTGERRLTRVWEKTIRDARPTVSHGDAVTRQRALNGVLGRLARRPDALQRPRAKTLLTDSLVALLLAPGDRSAAFTAPGPRRSWTPPRSRRQEIRDAAASLFRQHGYHGVGIDQIGKAAGISGPTVYGTYTSKAEILVDACDHAAAKLEVAIERAMEEAHGPEEALSLAVAAYATVAFTDSDIVAINTREVDALPEADRARINRRRAAIRQVRGAVLAQVRTDLDEHEARVLLVCADAAVQEMALVRRNRTSATAATDLILRFLLGSPAARG